MELLEIKELSKSYDDKKVLDNISLTIEKGRIVGLLGKNGVGKSTIIKLINGLLKPDSGEIIFNGSVITPKSRENIAYLPERTYLDKTMTVKQVLKFFEEFYETFDRIKARHLIKDLNLDLDQVISHMSKGMQEKLQLILVMSRVADLYILDEPLGGVDPATRDYILDTILNNINEGASVIMSTHLIGDIERILDQVVFINYGKVILNSDADLLRKKENGSIDEIFRRMFKC